MELANLAAFVAVADAGGFSAAATALHLTSPRSASALRNWKPNLPPVYLIAWAGKCY